MLTIMWVRRGWKAPSCQNKSLPVWLWHLSSPAAVRAGWCNGICVLRPRLVSAVINSSLLLPGTCTLSFNFPNRQKFHSVSLLVSSIFNCELLQRNIFPLCARCLLVFIRPPAHEHVELYIVFHSLQAYWVIIYRHCHFDQCLLCC